MLSSQNFSGHFVISQDETLFQISRCPLSSKSWFGINHTQWHRLFQGKASTIINGIDCYQERHRTLKMASLVYERENCVGATSSTREELNQFITAVNSFHPAFKYTWEISDTSLAFLDIKVSVEGNGLCTSVHYKPTDSHSYLLYLSSHPSHVKNSIPFSQFLRLRRLCSEDSDFSLKSEEMCEFFDKRGYPASVVEAGNHCAQQIDRQSALQTSQKENSNRIPFTLTFHPHNHAVKSIILKNFKLLQNDPDRQNLFATAINFIQTRQKHR